MNIDEPDEFARQVARLRIFEEEFFAAATATGALSCRGCVLLKTPRLFACSGMSVNGVRAGATRPAATQPRTINSISAQSVASSRWARARSASPSSPASLEAR